MTTFNRTAVRPIDRFTRTIQAIEAMNVLVCNTLETHDDHAFIASGVYELFEQQCANLQELFAHYHPEEGSASGTEAAVSARQADDAPLGADQRTHTLSNGIKSLVLKLVGEDLTLTEIAERVGLTQGQICAVIDEARKTHKDTIYANTDTVKETVKAFRQSIISEKISEGYDAGEIAQALNLKKQTVERVIAQLIGNEPTDEPEQAAANG